MGKNLGGSGSVVGPSSTCAPTLSSSASTANELSVYLDSVYMRMILIYFSGGVTTK